LAELGEGCDGADADMRTQRAEPTDRTPHPGLLIRFAHKRAALSPEGRGEVRWVGGNLMSFADTSPMLRIGEDADCGRCAARQPVVRMAQPWVGGRHGFHEFDQGDRGAAL
jgi:hypothetical protein